MMMDYQRLLHEGVNGHNRLENNIFDDTELVD